MDIPEGAIITEEMLGIKRPGIGLEPRCIDLVIGKRAKRHIKGGETVNWETIEHG